MANLNTHAATWEYMQGHPGCTKVAVVAALMAYGHDPSTVGQVYGKVTRGEYKPSTKARGGGVKARLAEYLRAEPGATKAEAVTALMAEGYDPGTICQVWYKAQRDR